MSFPGDELRKGREATGLSPVDLGRKLRIPKTFILAIESGSLENLPPKAYSLGFLRTYCSFLGLGPEPYLVAFEAATRKRKHFLGIPAATKDPAQRPAWLNEAFMWVTIVLLAALGWATYTLVFEPNPAQNDGRVHADSRDIRLPASTSRP